jgi:hypothetical protein
MSGTDSAHSPFRDGFAALFHEPVLLPAELVWRWCFGFSALALGLLATALFLDSLKLSALDEFLLGTPQPRLWETAFRHIFRGSLSRLVISQTILLLGVMLLWSLAATAGRAATLRRLVAMFRLDEETQTLEWRFSPILGLQLLRAMWALIAFAVTSGSLVYGTVMVQSGRPLRAALVLSFGVGVATVAGLALNWYFGIAPLFCVRERAGAMEALERAVSFTGRHAGELFLLGAGFLALRLLWAATMCLVFLSPLNWITQLDGRWVLLVMGLTALVYFAGTDLLYLARLGAYVSMAEDDAHPTPELESLLPEPAPPSEGVPLVGLA